MSKNNPINTEQAATTSLTLGLAGLVGWLVPLFGVPLALFGIASGIKGLNSERRGVATWGLVLCVLSLIATTVSATIGAQRGVEWGRELQQQVETNQSTNSIKAEAQQKTSTAIQNGMDPVKAQAAAERWLAEKFQEAGLAKVDQSSLITTKKSKLNDCLNGVSSRETDFYKKLDTSKGSTQDVVAATSLAIQIINQQRDECYREYQVQ